jgi:hypothetical protein
MTKSATSAAPQPELIEVTLDKLHTHKRKPCKAGDKIKVTEEQKSWLTQKGLVGGKQEDVIND